MGKSARKQHKNRTYESLPSARKTSSPHSIHDGKGTYYVDSDLLSSPHEFLPLNQLTPGYASPLRVVLTMVTTSIGAMALALPYAVLQGGIVMSIFLILFVALTTHLTRTRLVELGIEQGIYSFQGLAKLAFGPIGGFAVVVTQLGVSLGLTIAYLVITFQDVPIVLGHWLKMDFDTDGRPIVTPGTRTSALLILLADRHWFPEAFTVFVLVPYCLYANSYTRMRWSPAVVCVAIGAATCSAMVKEKADHGANVSTSSQGYDRDYLHVPSTVCKSFAIITMAVASQHHSFHTFLSMRDRCSKIFRRLSLFATLASVFAGLGIGIGGYHSFLNSTKGDVLHNYDLASNRLVLVFWTVLPISAVVCIAFELIASRHTVQFLCHPSTHVDEEKLDVLFTSQSTVKSTESDHVQYEEHELPWTSHVLAMVLLLLLAQIPIFYVSDVAHVLILTGGLAGITLCFILPAACQLKLSSLSGWCSDHFVPCLSIAIGVVGALAAVISSAA